MIFTKKHFFQTETSVSIDANKPDKSLICEWDQQNSGKR